MTDSSRNIEPGLNSEHFHRYCHVCDYSLEGHEHGAVCPECGTRSARKSLVLTASPPTWQTLVVFIGPYLYLLFSSSRWLIQRPQNWTWVEFLILGILVGGTIAGVYFFRVYVMANRSRLHIMPAGFTYKTLTKRAHIVYAFASTFRVMPGPKCTIVLASSYPNRGEVVLPESVNPQHIVDAINDVLTHAPTEGHKPRVILTAPVKSLKDVQRY